MIVGDTAEFIVRLTDPLQLQGVGKGVIFGSHIFLHLTNIRGMAVAQPGFSTADALVHELVHFGFGSFFNSTAEETQIGKLQELFRDWAGMSQQNREAQLKCGTAINEMDPRDP